MIQEVLCLFMESKDISVINHLQNKIRDFMMNKQDPFKFTVGLDKLYDQPLKKSLPFHAAGLERDQRLNLLKTASLIYPENQNRSMSGDNLERKNIANEILEDWEKQGFTATQKENLMYSLLRCGSSQAINFQDLSNLETHCVDPEFPKNSSIHNQNLNDLSISNILQMDKNQTKKNDGAIVNLSPITEKTKKSLDSFKENNGLYIHHNQNLNQAFVDPSQSSNCIDPGKFMDELNFSETSFNSKENVNSQNHARYKRNLSRVSIPKLDLSKILGNGVNVTHSLKIGDNGFKQKNVCTKVLQDHNQILKNQVEKHPLTEKNSLDGTKKYFTNLDDLPTNFNSSLFKNTDMNIMNKENIIPSERFELNQIKILNGPVWKRNKENLKSNGFEECQFDANKNYIKPVPPSAKIDSTNYGKIQCFRKNRYKRINN